MISAGMWLAVCLLLYHCPRHYFPEVLFCVALLTRILVVLTIETPVTSDFSALLKASRKMITEDFSYLDTEYFHLWPYQLGFSFYQSLLLRICNSKLFLKIVNCCLAAGTVVLVYDIARELAGERAARPVAFLYCFLPFPFFYVTVLSNQFPASFLLYAAIDLLINSGISWKSWQRYLAFGAILSIANVLRPESIIPLFSVLLFLLLTTNQMNWKENFQNFVLLLSVYLLLGRIFSYLFSVSGISPMGLGNNAPYWKFLLGFSHETLGCYNNADAPYLGDPEASWALIRSRILVPFSQLLDLFIEKIRIFWACSDLSWTFGYCFEDGLPLLGTVIPTDTFVPVLSRFSRHLMVIADILVIIGSVYAVRRKQYDPRFLILMNQVFVTFGVYLLIEIQARYIYYAQISLLILSALGIESIAEVLGRLKVYFRKVQKKEESINGIQS